LRKTLRREADEQEALVVILNVRSSQGGVNRLRDGFQGLCAVIAQDLLQGVKSKLLCSASKTAPLEF
jgi:hypothetical protein